MNKDSLALKYGNKGLQPGGFRKTEKALVSPEIQAGLAA